MKQSFILASASPRRIELLRQIYFEPSQIIPAQINEIPFKKERPSEFAKRMAEEKALNVLKNNPDTVILASDTVVACGRKILPKATNKEEALECLNILSGKNHRVYSGVCLLSKQFKTTKLVMTRVHFKHLSPREKNDYLNSNEWDGKAGGYAIQGLASIFIKKISGSYSNIVGLPLCETANLLTGRGIYPNVANQ